MQHYPHVYRNPAQAIDDGLFRNLGSVVSAYTLLAHIRRATVGNIGLLNYHPFQFGNWTTTRSPGCTPKPTNPAARFHAVCRKPP